MSSVSDTLPVPDRSLTLRILIPFAAGYFLSYLFRTVNAVIAPELTTALGLDATALGLLTSVYFLAFALFQLPLGMLLDRYGPRRVEAALLLIAAGGTLVFARSSSLEGLLLGRALIGLGASACLMAAFTATAYWFPPQRVAAMNGWILAAGGLGALTATRPVELALTLTDWRGVIAALAGLAVVVIVLLLTLAPDPQRRPGIPLRSQLQSIGWIYRNRYFWRVAPLAIITQAAYMSIQGLWAGPWFRDVTALNRAGMADYLLYTAAAIVAGFLLIGQLASRLQRVGIPLSRTIAAGLLVFLLAQLGICLDLTGYALPLWLLFGFFGSAGILAYPLLTQHFPADYGGRVNAAINLPVFVAAFLTQWSIGGVINLWPTGPAGHYAPEAYQWAFGLLLALQVLAFLWFLVGPHERCATPDP